MRTPGWKSVRLDRRFDCVFVHDAICYATSLQELGDVFRTALAHCRPGGIALFAPDYVRETFRPTTDHGGHDGVGRSLRYLEWVWDPDPADTTYLADFAIVLREEDGSVRIRHDRHVQGLFEQSRWLATLEEAGFVPRSVPWRHSEEPQGAVAFLGSLPP